MCQYSGKGLRSLEIKNEGFIYVGIRLVMLASMSLRFLCFHFYVVSVGI